MTILAFPSVNPSSIPKWALVSNTQSFTSPFYLTVHTLEQAGARWMATLKFVNLSEDEAREMAGFLVRLAGQAGRFYLHDHSLPSPRGVGTGTPLVKGASQTGRSLITDGWTTSVTGILKVGDYIGVNGELKMIAVEADSDSGGNATLSIEPPLRSSPADDSSVIITEPKATMMLIDDKQAGWPVLWPNRYNFNITAIEAFT